MDPSVDAAVDHATHVLQVCLDQMTPLHVLIKAYPLRCFFASNRLIIPLIKSRQSHNIIVCKFRTWARQVFVTSRRVSREDFPDMGDDIFTLLFHDSVADTFFEEDHVWPQIWSFEDVMNAEII